MGLRLLLLCALAGGEVELAEARRLLDVEANTRANLTAALGAYDAAIAKGLPSPEIAKARAEKSLAYLRLGDLATTETAKLALYEKGAREADAAIAADRSCARAHFYRAANRGRTAQTRGVVSSLSMLGELREGFRTASKLDPGDVDPLFALGKIDEEVPGLLGGSVSRAEKTYRSALETDPHFTRGKIELARLLRKNGKLSESREIAAQVRDEKSPTRPGDWQKFDLADAQELLAE
jgi:tetratricopeptide (TPR) repeat protein